MAVKKKTSSGNSKARQEAIKFLVQKAVSNDVKFIRIWFTDILGFLKSFAVTIDGLEKALTEGVGFDGSSIESFARHEEHDMVAMPDIETFEILPWRPSENAVARMFADINTMDNKPFEGDPRQCLKRQLKKARDLGFNFYLAPEIEFFYFKNNESPTPVDGGGYFDLTPPDTGSDLRRQTVLTLEEMGVQVHSSHHEVAPSQDEISLRYMDALTMADNTMTYRLVVKEIALQYGLYASFMPKPIEGQNGSGMHVHQSLFRHEKDGSEVNAFFDAKDKLHLSQTAKCYIAGLLKHAREIALVTNQWDNSYKRLVEGYEAPTSIIWARSNRQALVRIPTYKKGREQAVRAEFRSPDPACNPYLAYSAMLAAGLSGIKNKYALPDAIEEDVFAWSDEKKAKQGIVSLPGSLGEAIEAAEGSPFLKNALGSHLYESLIKNKKLEWSAYRAHVSAYEINKHLPSL